MAVHKKILIVDEHDKRRKNLLQFLYQLGFPSIGVPSVTEAANRLQHTNHFSLVIISALSSEEHKIDILRSIKSFNPQLSIIFLTKLANPELALNLIQQGAIDHVVNPGNLSGIYSAVKSEIRKIELLKQNENYLRKIQKLKSEQKVNIKKALDLEEIYDATIENLMTALDLRDVETFGHSRTVTKYTQTLAKIYGIRDKAVLDSIRKGAFLHDIGKIAIPDFILKKPNPLTSVELEKIKLHPVLGFGLIKEIKLVKEVGNIILYHHEHYDGSGYPKQLKKDEIPIEARIFALADALDAITSHRPYRKERDFSVAKNELLKNRGIQFDPDIVDTFCSLSLEKWEKIRFETTRFLPSFKYLNNSC